jgi:hypothetical protein
MARKKAKEQHTYGRDMTTGHATLEESKRRREVLPASTPQKDFDQRVRVNAGVGAIALTLLGVAHILGWPLIHPILLIVTAIGTLGLFIMTFVPRD